MSEDGWISWTGGECPVERDTLVWYMIRMEENCGFSPEKTELYERPSAAGGLKWQHSGEWDDLVLYRVTEEWHP